MTAAEVLTVYATVHRLLDQQATLFTGEHIDFAQAELLGSEITRLLASIPAADRLEGLDDTSRPLLIAAAQGVAAALALGDAALDQLHCQHLEAQSRAEREGAAVRHYQPPPGTEPARYCDERR